MDIQQMKYFLAVAREESISRAAKFLYITQPSLTRQIQSMEREVGRPLFVRGGRRLTLTETGAHLRKRAEEIVSLYEKTESELLRPLETPGGDVFIGGGETYAMKLLISVAKETRELNPDIRFHLFSGDIADVCERLDKGLIDFGLVIEPADLSKYEFLRLPVSDTWGVLLRKDNPLAQKKSVTPDDLRSVPVIISKHALNRSNVTEWFGSGGIPDIVSTYNLLYNASFLAEEGVGCVICLDKLINLCADSPLCFLPFSPRLESHISVVWKKYQIFSKAAQIFLEKLRRRVRDYRLPEQICPPTRRWRSSLFSLPRRFLPTDRSAVFCAALPRGFPACGRPHGGLFFILRVKATIRRSAGICGFTLAPDAKRELAAHVAALLFAFIPFIGIQCLLQQFKIRHKYITSDPSLSPLIAKQYKTFFRKSQEIFPAVLKLSLIFTFGENTAAERKDKRHHFGILFRHFSVIQRRVQPRDIPAFLCAGGDLREGAVHILLSSLR